MHLFSYFKLLLNFTDSDSTFAVGRFAVAERQTALHANFLNVGSLSILNIHRFWISIKLCITAHSGAHRRKIVACYTSLVVLTSAATHAGILIRGLVIFYFLWQVCRSTIHVLHGKRTFAKHFFCLHWGRAHDFVN